MSGFIKKLFGTLIQKPWEKEQATIDNLHKGKTFNLSVQKSAVLIIFGIATVLFSLVFTSYLYTLPPSQDTNYLLRPNLLWINALILFFVTGYPPLSENPLITSSLARTVPNSSHQFTSPSDK